MRYVALLRGINVGGNHKVEMKKLRGLFESIGCADVSSYINSGNIIFESKEDRKKISAKIQDLLKKEFDFAIPVLIKTEKEIRKIAAAIPAAWQNDQQGRTDVAYLFPEIDSRKTIDELPIKKEFIDIRYVQGAIFWKIDRKNYNKSHLNKMISSKLYRFMTIRNANTARYLAGSSKIQSLGRLQPAANRRTKAKSVQ